MDEFIFLIHFHSARGGGAMAAPDACRIHHETPRLPSRQLRAGPAGLRGAGQRAAGARRRGGGHRRHRQCRGGAAVLPARRASVARGGGAGPAALAAAPAGVRGHLRAVPAGGAVAASAVRAAGGRAAVPGPALRVCAAVHGAVVDRIHLDRAGQRAGGDLQRVGVQPAGHLHHAGAGGCDARLGPSRPVPSPRPPKRCMACP